MAWGAIAASAAGSVLDYIGGRERNKAAEAASARQMEFQERMSNTAHQREVADLKAAGLNPILSAGGGGASSPVGSSYVPENVLEGAGSSALATVRLKEDIKAIRAATAKAEQDRQVGLADAELKKEQKREVSARAGIEEAGEFTARNKVAFEAENPKLFGGLDAVLGRLGMMGHSVGSLLGAGAAGKYLFGGRGDRK